MSIITSKMTTTAPVLAIQYWPVLHNCHLILNIIVLTPALAFPTTMDTERSSSPSLKNILFYFPRWPWVFETTASSFFMLANACK
jgi:hypothetical protein